MFSFQILCLPYSAIPEQQAFDALSDQTRWLWRLGLSVGRVTEAGEIVLSNQLWEAAQAEAQQFNFTPLDHLEFMQAVEELRSVGAFTCPCPEQDPEQPGLPIKISQD